jgi:hypothetical protein
VPSHSPAPWPPTAFAAPPSEACVRAQNQLLADQQALAFAEQNLANAQQFGSPADVIAATATRDAAKAKIGPDKATVAAECDTPPTTTPAPTTTPVPPPGGTTPVARDDNYTTPVNKNLVIGGPGLLDNDSDADGNPLAASLVNGAQHGSVNIAGNGAFTYIPTTNYTGPDQFTYKACDPSGKCDGATVFINVGGTVTTPPPAGNGVVIYQTCAAAFRAGVHDIARSDPRYRTFLDRDGDGVACEANGQDGVTLPPVTVVRPPSSTTIVNPPAPNNTIVVVPPAQTFTSPQAPSSGAVATGDGSMAGTA